MKLSGLRNAALSAAAIFGRFGDTGKAEKIIKELEIRGTHSRKTKAGRKMRGSVGPDASMPGVDLDMDHRDEPFVFRPMPENPTLREFHNFYRQYRHRVWKQKDGTNRQGRERYGKRLTKLAKRIKVAAMKEAGHFRGDNRPFVA